MKPILTIAKRELSSFLNAATGYVVICAFLALSMFLLWRSALLSSEASMRDFFQIWPWFAMLLVPAVTMRSLTEEKRSATLEVLLSHPVKEWQIVVGKFLGSWAYLLLILSSILPSAFTLATYSKFDWGLFITQFLGASLVGGAFVALGILIASYTENLITSFLVTAALIFTWILIGMDYISMVFPSEVGTVLREVSITLRTETFNRGVINFKELVFFAIVIGLFLMLATIRLMSVKTVENNTLRSRLFLSTGIMILIGLVAYQTLSSLNLRLDLTKNQSASLTQGSKQTLSQLGDLVSLTFYTSSEVPGEYAFAKRYSESLLKDYVDQSKGKVRLSIKNPDKDPQIAQEAIQAGVQTVQFNSSDQNKLQVEKGYFGLVVSYGGKSDAIDFINDPQNLEYEITRRIRKLIRPQAQEIGIISSISSLDSTKDYSLLSQYLGTQYSLTDIDLSTQPDKLASISAALIVSPSEQPDSTASASLKQYLNNGGRLMLLLDRVEPNTQIGNATIRSNDWSSILSDYGISVNADMVYDLSQNESISISTNSPIPYAINYPYWVKATVSENFAPVNGIKSVTLAWPSSLTLTSIEGVSQTVLLKTSNQSGASTSDFTISPDQTPKVSQNQSFNLAASVEKGKTRIVVISDADLIIDQFTRFKGANGAFVSNLLDWLAADNNEAIVPRRDFSPAVLQFSDPSIQIPLVQWGNVIGGAVLVGVIGSWYLRRRLMMSNRQWHPSQ